MKFPLKILFVLCLISTALSTVVVAQSSQIERQNGKAAQIKNMMDDSRYIFKATYVTPPKGTGTALTAEYDLKVTKDTVAARLPYVGKSYDLINSSDADIRFICTNFQYKIKPGKFGAWEITIKPNTRNILDLTDVRMLKLNISPTGFASLEVHSYNREPISYSGYIRTEKQ